MRRFPRTFADIGLLIAKLSVETFFTTTPVMRC
jgi:hypothetical protein